MVEGGYLVNISTGERYNLQDLSFWYIVSLAAIPKTLPLPYIPKPTIEKEHIWHIEIGGRGYYIAHPSKEDFVNGDFGFTHSVDSIYTFATVA